MCDTSCVLGPGILFAFAVMPEYVNTIQSRVSMGTAVTPLQ